MLTYALPFQMVRSPSRGRPGLDAEEIAAYQMTADNRPKTVSSGRGGVGNVRSPSRDPVDRARIANEELRDQELQEEYRRREAAAPHYAPSGRGGRGNIHQEGSLERSVERSRSRSRTDSSQERGRKEGSVGSVRLNFDGRPGWIGFGGLMMLCCVLLQFFRTFSRSRSRDPSQPRGGDVNDGSRRGSFGSLGSVATAVDHTLASQHQGSLADVDEGPEVVVGNEQHAT